MPRILKGITWDHPRGYAPLFRGATEYERLNPGIKIRWDCRTLREFGEAPIERYTCEYDLIIIDHPFVGFAAAHDVLVDLSPFVSGAEKVRFAQDSVGPSWESYWYDGGLWAFPIDAATQVACYRPDLLPSFSCAVPHTLSQVIQLGKDIRKAGRFIIVPACPIDAISLFFTLSANLGHPIPEDADPFVEPSVARQVLDLLHELITIAHPRSPDWNPIQVYDFMITSSEAIYCPYGFGYSNYSRVALPIKLKFDDAPAAGQRGCAGTMLGGTGVAISRQCGYLEEALAYAKWLVTQEQQRDIYFREGGQPASLGAWTDPQVNAAANDFFSGTLRTLQTAYLRPRFDGFVRFFEAAGVEINRCLRAERSDEELIDWLNERYRVTRSAAPQAP